MRKTVQESADSSPGSALGVRRARTWRFLLRRADCLSGKVEAGVLVLGPFQNLFVYYRSFPISMSGLNLLFLFAPFCGRLQMATLFLTLSIGSAEDRVYNQRGRQWGRWGIMMKGEG